MHINKKRIPNRGIIIRKNLQVQKTFQLNIKLAQFNIFLNLTPFPPYFTQLSNFYPIYTGPFWQILNFDGVSQYLKTKHNKRVSKVTKTKYFGISTNSNAFPFKLAQS